MLWECYASLLEQSHPLRLRRGARPHDGLHRRGAQDDAAEPDVHGGARRRAGRRVRRRPRRLRAVLRGLRQARYRHDAVSPDRFSTTNTGVVESFECENFIIFQSATLGAPTDSCDADGYLDNVETAKLTVTYKNVGGETLNSTTRPSPRITRSFSSRTAAPSSSRRRTRSRPRPGPSTCPCSARRAPRISTSTSRRQIPTSTSRFPNSISTSAATPMTSSPRAGTTASRRSSAHGRPREAPTAPGRASSSSGSADAAASALQLRLALARPGQHLGHPTDLSGPPGPGRRHHVYVQASVLLRARLRWWRRRDVH